MPVDNRVLQRYRLLDKYFQEEQGNTYDELISKLEDEGIEVSERTIKADKKYFEDYYGAVFSNGLRRGKQAVIRYSDINWSASTMALSDEEKNIFSRLTEKLLLHDDIPQYQWMLFILDSIFSLGDINDLEDYIQFENNLFLEGLENFQPIMEACVGRYLISFEYSSYRIPERNDCIIASPYLLKQYNNRWYLICKIASYTSLSVFPLDRINIGTVCRAKQGKFEEPDRAFIGNCLNNSIGLTSIFEKNKRSDVVLSVSKKRFPYIRTKPIVPGQQIIKELGTDEVEVVKLSGVTINKELTSLILSFGPDIEVLEPLELRLEIMEKISECFAKQK